MNEIEHPDQGSEDVNDVEALHARNVLRGTPPPAADPAYRARLRESFSTGSIEHPAEGPARHGDDAAIAPEPLLPPRVIPIPRRRQSALWTGLAAAAAIAIAVMAGLFNRGPEWSVTAVRGDGVIRLDGVPYPAADGAMTARRIEPGVEVQVGEGAELDLRANGVLAMQLTGGTELTVPPTPARWFARRAGLHIRAGEIRVTTGPKFPGARLDVTTPDASLEVTGTTFAVILEPTGTCVCVFEGSVRVSPRDGAPMDLVSPGRRRYVYRETRKTEDAEMRDAERMKLSMFRDAEQHRMSPGRSE